MTDHKEKHSELCHYHDVDNCPDDMQDDVGWTQYKMLLDDYGHVADALEQAQDRIYAIEDSLQQVVNWANAYPLKVFPEPNWKEVDRMLGSKILSRVSASNMRHVVEGVGKIAAEALESAGNSTT